MQALAHLDSSIVDQEGAVSALGGRKPGAAATDQQNSLEQMRKALEKLTEGEGDNKDQQQQDQQDQQQQQQEPQQPQEDQQQQQKQQQVRSETAKDILDEEKKNREKRNQDAGNYLKLDKDW
jgi:hypothetical protein